MRRRYDRTLYAERVERIHSTIPNACIGADVIVGFPGETDRDFEESYEFIRELGVNYLHAFTYSERPGTAAAEMVDAVPMHIRRTRNARLRHLSDRLQEVFYTRFIGESRDVLLEPSGDPNRLEGYTDNYIKVLVNHRDAAVKTISRLTLQAYDPVHGAMMSTVEATQEVATRV
jgi:threonylcarbamoyladenosine tRNA methylthiotransferase MtaB